MGRVLNKLIANVVGATIGRPHYEEISLYNALQKLCKYDIMLF